MRSNVSSSPIGSIETISSHHRSEVASWSSSSSPLQSASFCSCGRETPRVPTCQLWLRGWPAAWLTSLQRPVALGREHAIPDRRRAACRRSSRASRVFSVGQRAPGLRRLAADVDEAAEALDAVLPGDADLARDLLGSLVDRALERADARHDAEPQEQVLNIAREPLADRRVADLAQAIGRVDVPVAGEEDPEEARDVALVEAEDRVGDELVSRSACPRCRGAGRARSRGCGSRLGAAEIRVEVRARRDLRRACQRAPIASAAACISAPTAESSA